MQTVTALISLIVFAIHAVRFEETFGQKTGPYFNTPAVKLSVGICIDSRDNSNRVLIDA